VRPKQVAMVYFKNQLMRATLSVPIEILYVNVRKRVKKVDATEGILPEYTNIARDT